VHAPVNIRRIDTFRIVSAFLMGPMILPANITFSLPTFRTGSALIILDEYVLVMYFASVILYENMPFFNLAKIAVIPELAFADFFFEVRAEAIVAQDELSV
jgi:hypothetical protein